MKKLIAAFLLMGVLLVPLQSRGQTLTQEQIQGQLNQTLQQLIALLTAQIAELQRLLLQHELGATGLQEQIEVLPSIPEVRSDVDDTSTSSVPKSPCRFAGPCRIPAQP